MKTCAAVLGMIGLFTSTAQAETVARAVVAGGRLELGGYSSLNPDCSAQSYPTLRVTNAPQHGTVTTRKGKTFTYFPPNHPLHDCNVHKVDGVLVDYRPERGFTGTDYFTIDAIYANGSERTIDYQITVK
jgi:hypothetical protein